MEKAFLVTFGGSTFVLATILVASTPADFGTAAAQVMVGLLLMAWALSLVGMLCSTDGATVHSTDSIRSRTSWEAETGDYDHHD